MARGVGDDELAPFGGEEPIGDVDGDPLFPLGGQAVDEEREVELAALGADRLGIGLERGQLVLEHELGVVEQPTDQGRLAVVNTAAGEEPKHRLVLVLVEVPLDVVDEEVALDVGHQKYPSCFFFSIEPDESWSITRPYALRGRGEEHLLDDPGERVRLALDGAGQGVAPHGAEPHRPRHHLTRLDRHPVVVDHDQRAVSLHDRMGSGEVEGDDRDVLATDVLPHVELGPVRQREHPHALPRGLAGVVEPPQLGALRLGIPAVLHGADREDPLLGPGLLLVTPGTAEGEIEAVEVEGLLEALGLPQVGVHRRAMVERVDAPLDAIGVLVHEQLHADFLGHLVAELVHGPELPRRVHVQQRERRHRRVEGLRRQAQHHRAVFTDRVQHHRLLRLRDRLTEDMDALGLEPLQVGQLQR